MNGQEWLDFRVHGKTPNASTMYRLLNPLVMMNKLGEVEALMDDTLMVEHETKLAPLVEQSDIIVFARIQVLKLSEIKHFVSLLKKAGKIIAFEHDDYYFKLSEGSYRKIDMDPESIKATEYLIKHADLITSPNSFLNESTIKYTGATPIHTATLPNALPLKDWDVQRATARKGNGQTIITLSGATNHYIDWMWLMPALKKVKKKYGERVHFRVLGFQHGSRLSTENQEAQALFRKHSDVLFADFREIGASTYMSVDFLSYPQRMCLMSTDIGVIVTRNEIYDQCKSILKFEEFTASGAACVCKREKPYTLEIPDDCVAYADTLDEYAKQIGYLVDHPQERIAMKTRAMQLVREKYDIEQVGRAWTDAFKTVYALKESSK